MELFVIGSHPLCSAKQLQHGDTAKGVTDSKGTFNKDGIEAV
jgi:hypothetical protein